LERCTNINGVLSDNQHHPECPAWFATPESRRAERPQDTTYLKGVAEFCGQTAKQLAKWFCSPSSVERAFAYRCVGEYHGFENLDGYPLRMSRKEAKKRYSAAMYQK
jgi:hypothetical protein